jgi:hypothetical protein
MATRQLVIQKLEMVSSGLLKKYKEIIREYIKGKQGVYALYLGDSLQYVGLATDLQARLGMHNLKDHLAGTWDNFSIYLTKNENHLKDLETLVIHIADPPANRQRGKFFKCEDILPFIRTEYRRLKDQEEEKIFRPSGKPLSVIKPASSPRPKGEKRGITPLICELLLSNPTKMSDDKILEKVKRRFPGAATWNRHGIGYVHYCRFKLNTDPVWQKRYGKPKSKILRFNADGKPFTGRPSYKKRATKS